MKPFFPLLLPSLLLHLFTLASATSFSQLAVLGENATANTEVIGIALAPDGQSAFVAGTTSPRRRGTASQFGAPSSAILRDGDLFVAKVGLSGEVEWAFRDGTVKDDRAESLLLASSGKHLYVAGSTFGTLASGPKSAGLADGFVIKYEVIENGLQAAWKRPLVIGSKGADALLHVAENPDDANDLFAVGYMAGGKGFKVGLLLRFRGSDGRIMGRRWWPGKKSVRAVAVAVAPGVDGEVFVAGETDRFIGTTLVSNFHLFRFEKKTMKPIGNTLLTSFATEQVMGIVLHPTMESTLLVAGISKSDETRRDDLFVKRLKVDPASANGSSLVVKVSDVKPPEYTSRIGGGAHDFGEVIKIHPTSGALLVAGHSTGEVGKSSGGKCECRANMAPFVAFINPVDGELVDVMQLDAPAKSWENVRAMVVARDGKSVVLAGKSLNQTSSLFFGSVSRFTVPGAWQAARSLADPVKPKASPKVTISGDPFPIVPVAAGAAGGFIVIMICLVSICCCCTGKKNEEPAPQEDSSSDSLS